MRILLVGGGTAGHLFPLVAVAKQLLPDTQKKQTLTESPLGNKISVHFVVADNDSDKYIVENAGYEYTQFSVAKLRRYFSWENFRDFFLFFGNIFSAIFFLKNHKPEKIFSKGGFVSLPIGIAAKILKIPFVLHETDKVMGLSNRILSRFATTILTGFPSDAPGHIFVGNPVRKEFFIQNSSREDQKFVPSNLATEHKTKILIFGGSQGAHALNQWARKFFAHRDEEVLLVTGKGKLKSPPVKGDLGGYANSINPPSPPSQGGISEVEFLLENFADAVHHADIVITRAGGSTSELAAAQKMVVLVPLPSSANDHQRANAKFFADQKAAIYIEESDLETDTTTKILEKIFTNPAERKIFEKNISQFADNNTVEKICEEIVGVKN